MYSVSSFNHLHVCFHIDYLVVVITMYNSVQFIVAVNIVQYVLRYVVNNYLVSPVNIHVLHYVTLCCQFLTLPLLSNILLVQIYCNQECFKNLLLVVYFYSQGLHLLFFNNETISGSYHWIEAIECNNKILCSAYIYLSLTRK